MDEVTVRKAQKEDASRIAKIHVETWQCAYRGQLPDALLDNLSVEQRTKRWEETLSKPQPGLVTFVAEIGGVIVGFCSVGSCRDDDMDGDTGELRSIYVAPESMSKGAGSRLHAQGLERLREQGYKKAILWVLTSNEKARQWYERRGWMVEGKTKTVERDGFPLYEMRYMIRL